MGKKTKASILTMLISVLNAAMMVIFNLIYTNYLIRTYGSAVNGLISTLTQFVSLFTIMEGGFTTAAIVATYEPIVKKDYALLNSILYTAKTTYIRIGWAIAFGVLVFESIYIRFINSPFTYIQTYSLLGISVLTTLSSLCFLSKYTILLQGNNKEYTQVGIALLIKTATWALSMIMILNNINIIIVYTVNLLNIVVNVLILKIYEKKKFPYAEYKGIYSKELIPGTSDILFQKIANTIFTSTDLILISVCLDLAIASVYNLYYQVFRSILTLLSSVVQAPANSFGQMVNEDDEKDRMSKYFEMYQHLILIIATIFLTITAVMIIPFVRVYTAKVKDFNYVYPSLSFLFFTQIFMQIVNRPYGTILNATGNFKMQNVQCGIAAIVNLIVSILFVNCWGMNSIIFGSCVGTLIILIMNIWQTYKNVIRKSCVKVMKNILINYFVAMCIIWIFLSLDMRAKGYFRLVMISINVSVFVGTFIMILNMLVDYPLTIRLIKFMGRLIRRR